MIGDIAVELFESKIDRDQTAKQAGKFLNKDFQVIKNYAGASATDLSSPLLDPTGVVNHSHVNHADLQFLGTADQYKLIASCQRAVRAVMAAIKACSNGNRKPYGTLLYLRYIKYDFDTNVYNTMGYSKSQYYKFRKDALIEFAQILPSKQLEYTKKDDFDIIPELIVKTD